MNVGTVRNMPELTFIGDSFFFKRNGTKQLNMHGENIRWPFSLILNTVLVLLFHSNLDLHIFRFLTMIMWHPSACHRNEIYFAI